MNRKRPPKATIKAKQGELLFVEAIDLTTKDDVWLPASQAARETPMKVHVAGFYLGHDEHSLRLTSMLTTDDNHAGPLVVVPLGAIIRWAKLGTGTKVPK